MHVLVFNCGSSSLKFGIFDVEEQVTEIHRGAVTEFGSAAKMDWSHGNEYGQQHVATYNHADAAHAILSQLDRQGMLKSITLIGHRIVHGGGRYDAPISITDAVLKELEGLSMLAPLHNPPALMVLNVCRAKFVTLPMVAVFDTAYFHTLPDYVSTYALPSTWSTEPYAIRRYGFHGIAHRYMVERFHATTGSDEHSSRVISLQLGQGCSMTAVRGRQPLETSMGFTPLEGLIMATRPGDVDVGVLLHLIGGGKITARELGDSLNEQSGLLALSGISSDMKALLTLEAQGHPGAVLAVQAFCHRARKYLGAYLAVLGGADAIIFGGGIGERASEIRARICAGMEWCGLVVDQNANEATVGVEGRITAQNSRIQAYVIPVDEELFIAQDAVDFLRNEHMGGDNDRAY